MLVRWHFHKPVGCLPFLLGRARHRRLERLSPPRIRRQTRRRCRWWHNGMSRLLHSRKNRENSPVYGRKERWKWEKKVSFTPAAAMSSLVDFEHEITFLSRLHSASCQRRHISAFSGKLRLWHVGEGFWLIAFFALGDNDRVRVVPVRMPKNAPLAMSVRRQMHQRIHTTIARCRTVV